MAKANKELRGGGTNNAINIPVTVVQQTAVTGTGANYNLSVTIAVLKSCNEIPALLGFVAKVTGALDGELAPSTRLKHESKLKVANDRLQHLGHQPEKRTKPVVVINPVATVTGSVKREENVDMGAILASVKTVLFRLLDDAQAAYSEGPEGFAEYKGAQQAVVSFLKDTHEAGHPNPDDLMGKLCEVAFDECRWHPQVYEECVFVPVTDEGSMYLYIGKDRYNVCKTYRTVWQMAHKPAEKPTAKAPEKVRVKKSPGTVSGENSVVSSKGERGMNNPIEVFVVGDGVAVPVMVVTPSGTSVPGTPTEVPVTTVVSESPVTTVVSESPVTTVVSESPVTTVVSESPVKTVVSDAPVTTLVSEADVAVVAQPGRLRRMRSSVSSHPWWATIACLLLLMFVVWRFWPENDGHVVVSPEPSPIVTPVLDPVPATTSVTVAQMPFDISKLAGVKGFSGLQEEAVLTAISGTKPANVLAYAIVSRALETEANPANLIALRSWVASKRLDPRAGDVDIAVRTILGAHSIVEVSDRSFKCRTEEKRKQIFQVLEALAPYFDGSGAGLMIM